MNNTSNKIYFKLFILILILSIAIKSTALDTFPYDDEAVWMMTAVNASSFGYHPLHWLPPLSQWLNILSISLFGITTLAFRLVPLIFSSLTIILTYLFTKNYYNKKAGFLAALILIFSFYHNIASLQIDVEGGMLTFFFLGGISSFLKSKITETETKNSLKFKIVSGIFLGLALLTKSSGILIALIIGLYSLLQNKNIINTIKDILPSYLTGILIFGLYPLTAYMDPLFSKAGQIHHVSSHIALNFYPLSLGMFILWSTPLLIGLLVLALKEHENKDNIFIIWILTVSFFNLFLISRGDYSRYYMNIIPAIAIIGGNFLSKLNFKKKEIISLISISLISAVTFIFISSIKSNFIPRIPSLYFQELKNLNLNFIISITGSSGPTLGINFIIIAIGLLSLSLIPLFMIFKNKRIGKISLIIFLGISLGLNLFMIEETYFHLSSKDISKTQYTLLDLSKEYPGPFFSNDEGIMFMIDNDYWNSENVGGLPDYEIKYEKEKLNILRNKINNSTILILNWPEIPKESPIWKITKECKIIKEITSQNLKTGYIINC